MIGKILDFSISFVLAYLLLDIIRQGIRHRRLDKQLDEIRKQKTQGFVCLGCGNDDKFLEGPHGVNAINFACSDCFTRYNDLGVYGIEQIGVCTEKEMEMFYGAYKPLSSFLHADTFINLT